uniref:Pancreatic trypsin inhibitor n=1 Tax=Rhipicephalus appendiculatus TaxID=34631 RepID=A0A131YTU2_RHIAP
MKFLLLLFLTIALVLTASLITGNAVSQVSKHCNDTFPTGKCPDGSRPSNSKARWSYLEKGNCCSISRWATCIPTKNVFDTVGECQDACLGGAPEGDCEESRK